MGDNKKTISNRLFTLFGVLLVGAVGSGLWDLILKDVFYNIGSYFVQIVSHFYKGYLDVLYENVGKMNNAFEMLPGLLIITIIILFPFFMGSFAWTKLRNIDFKKLELKQDEVKQDDVKKTSDIFFEKFVLKYLNTRGKIVLFAILLGIPISLTYVDVFVTESSNYTAYTYVERCIEIVRPDIENAEYFVLRREFRQIDSRQKLNDLINKLHLITLDSSVKLPKCKLYGISVNGLE